MHAFVCVIRRSPWSSHDTSRRDSEDWELNLLSLFGLREGWAALPERIVGKKKNPVWNQEEKSLLGGLCWGLCTSLSQHWVCSGDTVQTCKEENTDCRIISKCVFYWRNYFGLLIKQMLHIIRNIYFTFIHSFIHLLYPCFPELGVMWCLTFQLNIF